MATSGEPAKTEKKLSKLELVKEASAGLRGTIAAELADAAADHVESDSANLLKFHGTYQQDNRDLRKSRRKEGLGKAYSFMIRNRIPGGKMTAEQFLAELDICDELGEGTARVTTRQSIQLHGVVKGNLRDTINRINQIKLSTQSACGDVVRNVCSCPAPLRHNSLRDDLQQLADEIADMVKPATGAYYELWVKDPETGEKEQVQVSAAEPEHEPLYGKFYLPRKFKIGLAFCDDNCIDLYSHDIGLLAVTEGDKLLGYNVLVGGGFGTTPSKKDCEPILAKKMAFISREEVLPVVAAIVMVQRDFGNRETRAQARMKYLIRDWGIAKFKAKVEEYLPKAEELCGVDEGTVRRPLPEPHEADVTGYEDHLGWHEQGDGKFFYGVPIDSGRIKDDGDFRLKAALRELMANHVKNVRLTMQQNVLLCDLDENQRDDIERILREHGALVASEITNLRRNSFSCVALPTCGLAVTESERVLPDVIREVEGILADLGMPEENFTIRMTGCPNGCARPYNADIGLVGRSVDGKTGEGKYTIFVGGNLIGTRLNKIYKDMVLLSDIAGELRPLLTDFRDNRQNGETFGDYLDRSGVAEAAS